MKVEFKKSFEKDLSKIREAELHKEFSVNEDTVVFVRVLHRKEIYRYFP
jgi:mRNA interferase RelE/StbE